MAKAKLRCGTSPSISARRSARKAWWRSGGWFTSRSSLNSLKPSRLRANEQFEVIVRVGDGDHLTRGPHGAVRCGRHHGCQEHPTGTRRDRSSLAVRACAAATAGGSGEYSMFEHFRRYPWILETYTYPSLERLIANLGERVIGPAEDYARSIRERCAGPRPVQVEEPSGAGGEA
jgi:hypothetical protein